MQSLTKTQATELVHNRGAGSRSGWATKVDEAQVARGGRIVASYKPPPSSWINVADIVRMVGNQRSEGLTARD